MGNDIKCEQDKECRYKELYSGIYATENDILDELKNPDYQNKKYITYGLINQGLCRKYPYLLKDKFDYNLTKNYNFKYKDILHSNVDSNFNCGGKKFGFYFPANFIFINNDFMNVIHDMVNEPQVKNKLVSNFDTIIGGGCLIMKNPDYSQSLNPYRYIVLYREIKENIGNEIDFFLYIKDKKKRDDTVSYILKNGIWNFFAKIQYKYKDEYKQFDDGYIVRSSKIERIELYINNLKNKKFNYLQIIKMYNHLNLINLLNLNQEI